MKAAAWLAFGLAWLLTSYFLIYHEGVLVGFHFHHSYFSPQVTFAILTILIGLLRFGWIIPIAVGLAELSRR